MPTAAPISEIPANMMLHTTDVEEHFLARLAGVPSREVDVVRVTEGVRVGDRLIIRAASGEGFWHVAADRSAESRVPSAVFEPHETVSFTCRAPARY